jgi:hypothetical protein
MEQKPPKDETAFRAALADVLALAGLIARPAQMR